MAPRLTPTKCIFYMCILTVSLLFLYSLTLSFHFFNLESVGKCWRVRGLSLWNKVKSPPYVFMSKDTNVTDDIFNWWKKIQGSKRNFTYFKETVTESFKLIPPVSDAFKPRPGHCRTCAVVGNSGHLIASHFGSLIDSHDAVIRINRGVVEGYEEDVGSKITHRVLYPESSPRVKNTTKILFFPYKVRDFDWLRQRFNSEDPKWKLNKDMVTVLHPAFMKYVYDVWLDSRAGYGSTGFMTVILALAVCDEVSVFGFGADADGNWSHYFEKAKFERLGTGLHSGKREYRTLEQLHVEGQLKFFKKL
ncbi:CMP-N-acetylneuraminate-beta-galactosamide-alpha-2%2C3-sialyltransferase 1-like [Xyrichtys novacula]|uniref:CMP-N-acetylneuraminate-beta-galactosamide-alpha-2,3-sialyltransferase 1 n=1 Tax=Xyrichtys novacula TaxID=13765 RepID=A0AAV1EZZ6_XYRNO|nr:CMP-N-acetylneuraminate-beta-galactosamide-alpha-2%2C3-sialyltransferase 1-like [Xyrichtys novacula]